MQKSTLLLFVTVLLAGVPYTAHTQDQSDQMFVCLYSAPLQKTVAIMHDIYQGIAHSSDGGEHWVSQGSKLSLMNDLSIQPGSRDLFVASEYGVLKSDDNGVHWKQLNGWDIETVFRVAFQEADIWLATPKGPAVSRDGGKTWDFMLRGLQPLQGTYVSDISIDGGDILISTADGIFLSTDKGSSWHPSGLQGQEIDCLVRHPKSPESIAAYHLGKGIWFSADNGRTWNTVNSDLYSTKVQAFAFDPRNPDVMYAGMSDYPVCKTTDGGKSWKTINTGLTINSITALAVDPANPERVFTGTENGLWKSTNGGKNWEPSTMRFGYVTSIVVPEGK